MCLVFTIFGVIWLNYWKDSILGLSVFYLGFQLSLLIITRFCHKLPLIMKIKTVGEEGLAPNLIFAWLIMEGEISTQHSLKRFDKNSIWWPDNIQLFGNMMIFYKLIIWNFGFWYLPSFPHDLWPSGYLQRCPCQALTGSGFSTSGRVW